MNEQPMAGERFFAFEGTVTHEVGGEDVPLTGDELESVIDHLLFALNAYARDGFRFVDVDASATLTNGAVRIAWNRP